MKNKRSFFKILYPSFQWKLIFWGSIPALSVLGFLGYKFYSNHQRLLRLGKTLDLRNQDPFWDMARFLEKEMFFFLALSAVVTFISTSLYMYYVSNKMAGPIYRLKSDLKKMRDSDQIIPIYFRNGDYTKDLENDLNWVLETKQSEKNKSA